VRIHREYKSEESEKSGKRLIRTRYTKIDLEEWFYNLGKHSFTRTLVFRDKLLYSIIQGSYGFPYDMKPPTESTQKLVFLGDSKSVVRLKMGEPTCQETDNEVISTIDYLGEEGLHTLEHIYNLNYEDWIYDMGSSKFVRLLRFQNNRLISMKEEGKGLGEDICRDDIDYRGQVNQPLK